MPTIIGAGAFHRPVRDGKGWFHSAMVVRQRGEDQGFELDPAFGLSGCRRSFDLGPTALFTLTEVGVLEEGFWVELVSHTNTRCMLLKIIGSSLTGN